MVTATANTEARRTLTVKEAAQYLGIGHNAAYKCVKTGEIPSVTLGGRILVPRQALENLLDVKAA